ncbi:MAG: hypothetical protein A2103_05265 [Gammaproteobacteria bacterium GWF2_41_13]|nr:MAG: hypothetical protein A2103_05265 [Gammaproteobacteria bacterium GWF2_41_13]
MINGQYKNNNASAERLQIRESAPVNYYLTHDDQLLDSMRLLIKDYIHLKFQRPVSQQERATYRLDFETLRQQLTDTLLKTYITFELMDRLYTIEYTYMSS